MSDASEREALIRWLHNEGDDGIWEVFDLKHAEQFTEAVLASRWLAAHDRAVERRGEVKALREAADALNAEYRQRYERAQSPEAATNASRFREAARIVRDRADRIEAEGGEGR